MDEQYKAFVFKLRRGGYMKQSRHSGNKFQEYIDKQKFYPAYVMLKEGYVCCGRMKNNVFSSVIQSGAEYWGLLAKLLIEKRAGYLEADISFYDQFAQGISLVDQIIFRIRAAGIPSSKFDDTYEKIARSVITDLYGIYPDICSRHPESQAVLDDIRKHMIAEEVACSIGSAVSPARCRAL